MVFELICTVFSIIALVGAYLNSRQDIRGFHLWLISNAWFFFVNLTYEHYAIAGLFAAYFFIALNGLFTWKRKSSPKSD